GEGAQPGSDVHRDAGEVVTEVRDLTGVHPGTHLEPERRDGLLEGERGVDRAARAVEGREHTITHALHEHAPIPFHFTPRDVVVLLEHRMPSSVAHLRSGPRRM